MGNDQKLTLLARLLLCFCREPEASDYQIPGGQYKPGKELEELESLFPGFREELAGTVVLDFGCGDGYDLAAFCQAGARRVIGVDINPKALDEATRRVEGLNMSDRITCTAEPPNDAQCEVIVSKNSFEHFVDADHILAVMRSALKPKGKIFITFAPPWYAPWGGHMAFFCRLPWVQILFPERTVIEVRSHFRPTNAARYEDLHLAKMSIRKFNQIVRRSGLCCSSLRYDCVWGMNWLQFTPLRELFVNRISCVLTDG